MHPERPFFIAGGTLRHDAPSYVERRADRELLESLRAGEFCYVLTPRQMGKSSLMVRTAAKLRDEGVTAVVLDLSALGQNLTPEQWYEGLLMQLALRLSREAELEAYWREHAHRAPLQRFMGAVREVLLARVQGEAFLNPEPRTLNPSLVLFIDEIDAVRSLPFPTDEFFAAIRECYNRRPEDPRLEGLTFCLLGVAAPTDLIRDARMTPFNIGRRIELEDFTEDEAGPLARGLVHSGNRARLLLRRILYWTGGHPYLTQRLCQAVCERMKTEGAHTSGHMAGAQKDSAPSRLLTTHQIDRLCADVFLARGAREKDDNLIFVRERLLRSELPYLSHGETVAALLERYGQVRAGRRVPDDDTDPRCELLKLSGIVRTAHHSPLTTHHSPVLEVRNRIYARAFDREWVARHLPDAEARRLRAAYRRGLVRATALSGVVVAVMAGLAGAALKQTDAARRAESKAHDLARKLGRNNATLQEALTLATQEKARAERERIRADRSGAREAERAGEARRSATAAEQSAQEARESSEQAQAAERVAREKGEESDHRLARLVIAHGAGFLSADEPYSALPHFAQALARGRSPAREEATLLRVGSILRYSPRLAVFRAGTRWYGTEAISPDGRLMLATDGKEAVRVREIETGAWASPPLVMAGEMDHAAFSADGRQVAVASPSGARVWNLPGDIPGPLLAPGSRVASTQFSSDGRRLLAFSRDGLARVWDPRTGHPLSPIIGPTIAAVLSPDGRKVVTLDPGHVLQIRETGTGARLATCRSPVPRDVSRPVFSPDGQRLAAVAAGLVCVWDASSGSLIGAPLPITGRPLETMRFSPDSRLIACWHQENAALVWDPASGKTVGEPRRHTALLTDVAFSQDGRQVVTASYDMTVRVWDTETGQPLSPPLPHSTPVAQVQFSTDGGSILTQETTGAVRRWETGAARQPGLCIGEYGNVMRCRFSPDGRRIVTIDHDWSARIWDAAPGRALTPALEHSGRIYDAVFSPNGRCLATASEDGWVCTWDARTGTRLLRLPQKEAAAPVVFSPDGRRLAVRLWSKRVAVWDAVAGRRLALSQPLRCPGEGDSNPLDSSLQFSPDGRRLLFTSGVGTEAYVIEGATGRRLLRLSFYGLEIRSARFSADGARITTSGHRGAGIWDANTGQLRVTIQHPAYVRHAEFSRDGRRLLTAGDDSTARIWDAATGRLLVPPLRHQGAVYAATFSRDGTLVATGSEDGTARVWEAATGEPVTPPLPHFTTVRTVEFAPGTARRLLTQCKGGTARVWELPRDRHRPEDLRRAAALLAAQSDASYGSARAAEPTGPASGNLDASYASSLHSSLAATEHTWALLSARYPEDKQVTPGQRRSWLLERAAAGVEAGNTSAAIGALDRLLAEDPGFDYARIHRAVLHAKLGHWETALRDQQQVKTPDAKLIVLASHAAVRRAERDRSTFKTGGQIYRRGLRVSDSEILVCLPAPARRFSAIVAPEEGPLANDPTEAIAALEVGGHEVFVSPPLAAGAREVQVAKELYGATAVILKVRRTGSMQHPLPDVYWANARIELANGRTLWLGELRLWALGNL